MEYYKFLLPLAMILLLSKLLSIGCKKIGLPQVVGMLLAGILLGLIEYIPNQQIFTSYTMEGLSFLSKIGVVLIMFSAGIETDLKQMKASGLSSIVITSLGVIVPLGLGFIIATAFNGGFTNMSTSQLYSNLFYGTILSATSVSVTVATLKELGKLGGKVGTAIVSAAILDDIIGVILLSVVIGLEKTGGVGDIGIVFAKTIGFFVCAIVVGILIHFLFGIMDKKWPHNRRIPIFSFAICFFYAYAAEHWFGVADITGAYIAGIMLSGIHSSNYIDNKVEVSNYLIFGPVFFANIGLSTKFSGIDGAMIGFGVCYVLIGLISKFLGCGLGAKMCKFSLKDSARVGVGMMVRAEVVLVCTQKGIENNMVNPDIMPFVLILIVASSFLTPLLLKLLYKNDKDEPKLELNPETTKK